MKPNRFKKAFYNRKMLLIVVASALLISFTLTNLIGFQATREAITNNLKYEALPLISDNIYSELQQDLITPIENSSLMANDEFLINWVLSGESGQIDVVRYLKRITKKYDYFSAFYVSEQTKNYYYQDGVLKQISPEDKHDVWYYTFRDSGLDYDLDVDTNQAANNTLTIFINHRLEDEQGNFLGVTGVGLEMQSIGKTLDNYRERYKHQVYMIDSSGLIQVHPNQDWIEVVNIKSLPGMETISEQILSNREGTNIYEYRDQKKEMILSTRYFPDFDWFLIVEEDKTASLKSAKNYLIFNLLVGSLVSLLITLLIMFMINRFSKRLEALATNDPLTGLNNRRKFQELFERELNFAKRYNQPLSVLFLDIDDFKSVNDQYGHTAGDQYLKEFSRALSDEIREVDVLARWGGEEFAVLLNNLDTEGAYRVAERIRQNTAAVKVQTPEGKISRTISIGITTSHPDQMTMENILKVADQALLRAKQSGKNKTWIAGDNHDFCEPQD